MSDVAVAERRDLDALQRRALIVGGAGMAVLLIGAAVLYFMGDPYALAQFFRSYLLGYFFWGGLSLGMLLIMVLHQLTGGAWGLLIRRIMEAGARTIPFMALLFIPILLGNYYLYEWTHADIVAADPVLQHKVPWLNLPFFIVRQVIYFAVWTFVAYRISGLAVAYDRTQDPAIEGQMRTLGGLAMLLVVITVTFATFDWTMSIEPHWFSSIYGAMTGSGMMLAAFAVSIIMVTWLARRTRVGEVLSAPVLGDVGSLMMAFTLIWAYLNFSQLLIIYAADLPEEVTWYIKRMNGGWEWIAAALIVFHFVAPFVLLMSTDIRRNPHNLPRVAAFILFMNFVYVVWLVRPAFEHSLFVPLSIHWMDLVATIGLGGIWFALFLWQLKKQPLVPTLAIPVLQERAHAH